MIEIFSYNLFTIRSLFGDFRFTEKEKIQFISNSSTEIKPGTLFVPLRGNRDGHEFILDALAKGASAFLCEKKHPILKKLPPKELQKSILVDHTLTALGILASFHRNRFNPILIGITGSSGKTTTKELMGLVCEQIGTDSVVVTEKNYNNEIGVPFTLFRIKENTKIVICEMGMNHKGEISKLTAMARPTIGIVTNVGPCHIENLGSLQNIARAKAEIMEGMEVGGNLFIHENIPDGTIFLEIANKLGIILSNFSIQSNPDIQIEKILPNGFKLKVFNKNLNWKIPGGKILENLSAVIEVSKKIGLNPNQILKGLSLFEAKDKRFVIEKNFYQIINDTYNANPDSMNSSLSALKQVASNHPCYAILGDMKELGKFSKNYHLQLGETCKSIGLSGLITFGKDSEFITKQFISGNTIGKVAHFIDSNESIKKLISFVKAEIPKGSFILVKGSRSMKMERIVEGLKY